MVYARAARHIQRTGRMMLRPYPAKAEELRGRWPGGRLGLGPWYFFQCSFWENDVIKDEHLRMLRRKAITSFLTLGLLMALLVFLGFVMGHQIDEAKSEKPSTTTHPGDRPPLVLVVASDRVALCTASHSVTHGR